MDDDEGRDDVDLAAVEGGENGDEAADGQGIESEVGLAAPFISLTGITANVGTLDCMMKRGGELMNGETRFPFLLHSSLSSSSSAAGKGKKKRKNISKEEQTGKKE